VPTQPWNSTGNGSRFQIARFVFTLFHFLTIVRFDGRMFSFFAFSSFHGRAFFGSFLSGCFCFFVFALFNGFFGDPFTPFDHPRRGRSDRVRACGGLSYPERGQGTKHDQQEAHLLHPSQPGLISEESSLTAVALTARVSCIRLDSGGTVRDLIFLSG